MNATRLATSGNQPRVTWLLSVKNSAPFIRQTLESIYQQTYTNHELLVWDDCSTDGTLEELKRWVPRRIPGIIFSGRSLRLGASLAFLVEQAQTELCARIDGDDVNLPHRLQRQVEFMLEHPEVGVLGSATQHIDEDGLPSPGWPVLIRDEDIRWRTRWKASFYHPTVMFRRSVVLAAGNYRDFPVEDLDLWMRMSLLTEFHNLAETLLQYRRCHTSLTGSVEDFYPLDERAASLNAAVLFPNIKDTAYALSLWKTTHPCRLQSSARRNIFRDLFPSFRNVQAFENSAVVLARKLGKPDNYFSKTETFQHQRYWLRQQLLDCCGLRNLGRLRAHLDSHRKRVGQLPIADPKTVHK